MNYADLICFILVWVAIGLQNKLDAKRWEAQRECNEAIFKQLIDLVRHLKEKEIDYEWKKTGK